MKIKFRLLFKCYIFILTLDIKSALHIHTENMHPEVRSRSDKIHCRRVIL